MKVNMFMLIHIDMMEAKEMQKSATVDTCTKKLNHTTILSRHDFIILVQNRPFSFYEKTLEQQKCNKNGL